MTTKREELTVDPSATKLEEPLTGDDASTPAADDPPRRRWGDGKWGHGKWGRNIGKGD
jgi:hypothetical protein